MAKFEIIFDIIYLISVISIGFYIYKKAKKQEHKLFGIMAIILGLGDSFHLIPRIIALYFNDFSRFTFSLGIGKMITSLSMTVFYLILYIIFKIRYEKKNYKKLDLIIYFLVFVRIVLSILPQNEWTSINPSYVWGIYRNIAFVIMGFIILFLFYSETKKHDGDIYSKMSIAISLSFLFYILVVLFASTYPIFGAFMMPKTVAYVWIVLLGFKDLKKSLIQ